MEPARQRDLSIWPIIGTVYVSIVAILIAIPIGVGTTIILSTYTSNRIKRQLGA